jgi:oxaloacetate decarboxylase (Na+ extruding) subunit gamma
LGDALDTTVLLQGVELMLLGMSIVFGFLTLLVFIVRIMSALALRIAPPASVAADITPPVDISDNRELIAVITAAVARYRASRAA